MAETSRPVEAEEDEEGEEAAEVPARAVLKRPAALLELRAGNRAARVSPAEQATVSPPARQKAAPPDTKASPCQAALNRPSPRPQAPAPPPSPRPQAPAPPQAAASPSQRPEASAPPSSSGVNLFANDGSFLEMFKKKMEKSADGEEPRPSGEGAPGTEKRKPIGFVGKRRGGARLALKTGIVAKKPKNDGEEVLSSKGGAWAQYMAEVKKYKAHQCSDDDKTRPLVK